MNVPNKELKQIALYFDAMFIAGTDELNREKGDLKIFYRLIRWTPATLRVKLTIALAQLAKMNPGRYGKLKNAIRISVKDSDGIRLSWRTLPEDILKAAFHVPTEAEEKIASYDLWKGPFEEWLLKSRDGDTFVRRNLQLSAPDMEYIMRQIVGVSGLTLLEPLGSVIHLIKNGNMLMATDASSITASEMPPE